MYIETHCHLDYLKALPLGEILKKSEIAQIAKIITIGVDPDNLDPVFELALNNDQIYCTQGIHPHDAQNADDLCYQKIMERAQHPKMVAVGEIGLDYHYNHSPRDIQIKVFETQLDLAVKLNLPVVIHTREADEDLMSILKNYSRSLLAKGVVHSFTSSIELAEFVLSEEFYLGFNGIVTFKNAKNVQDVVRISPPEKILFETDSPFLTPVPFRGQENAPFHLPYVAKKIAELKMMDQKILEETVFENSLRCFSKLRN